MRKWAEAALAAIAIALAFILDSWAAKAVVFIRNPVFDAFFHWISVSLFTIALLLVLTSIALFEGRKKEWILPLWLSALSAMIVIQIAKLVFMRERPDEIVMTYFWIKDFSFPSAHAGICFALVPILDREFPRFSLFWVGFAVLVAASRLYLGVHYLSDVVVGALVGYAIGVMIIKLIWRAKHARA